MIAIRSIELIVGSSSVSQYKTFETSIKLKISIEILPNVSNNISSTDVYNKVYTATSINNLNLQAAMNNIGATIISVETKTEQQNSLNTNSTTSSSDNNMIIIIIAVVVGASVLLIIIICVYCYYRKHQQTTSKKQVATNDQSITYTNPNTNNNILANNQLSMHIKTKIDHIHEHIDHNVEPGAQIEGINIEMYTIPANV
jgi:heme/copper-type cytochrome/quinol oxidase subunit 1